MSQSLKHFSFNIVLAIFLFCEVGIQIHAKIVASRQLSTPNNEFQLQTQNKDTPLSNLQNTIFNQPASIPRVDIHSLVADQGGQPLAIGLPSSFRTLSETVYAYLASTPPSVRNPGTKGHQESGTTPLSERTTLFPGQDNIVHIEKEVETSKADPETTLPHGKGIRPSTVNHEPRLTQGPESIKHFGKQTEHFVHTSRTEQHPAFQTTPSLGEEPIPPFREQLELLMTYPELPQVPATTSLPVEGTGSSEPFGSTHITEWDTTQSLGQRLTTISNAPDIVSTSIGGHIPTKHKTVVDIPTSNHNLKSKSIPGSGSTTPDTITMTDTLQKNVTKENLQLSQSGKAEPIHQVRSQITTINNLVSIINRTIGQGIFSDVRNSQNDSGALLLKTLSEMTKIRKLISLINDTKSPVNFTSSQDSSPVSNLSKLIANVGDVAGTLSRLSSGNEVNSSTINSTMPFGTTSVGEMLPKNVSKVPYENQINSSTTMFSANNTNIREVVPENVSQLSVENPVNPSMTEATNLGSTMTVVNDTFNNSSKNSTQSKVPTNATTAVNSPTSSQNKATSDTNTLLNSISLLELQRLVNGTDGFSLNISSIGNLSREHILQNLLIQFQDLQNSSKLPELVIANNINYTLPENIPVILQTQKVTSNKETGNNVTSGNLDHFPNSTEPTTSVGYTNNSSEHTNGKQSFGTSDINNLLNSISLLDLQQLVNQTEGISFNLEGIGELSRVEILRKLLEKIKIVQERVSPSNQTDHSSRKFTNSTLKDSINNKTNNEIHLISPSTTTLDTNNDHLNIRDPRNSNQTGISTGTIMRGVTAPNNIISSSLSSLSVESNNPKTNIQNHNDQFEISTTIPSTPSKIFPLQGNAGSLSGTSDFHDMLNAVSLEDLQKLVNQTQGIDFNLATLGNLSREQILQNLFNYIQDFQKENSNTEPSNALSTLNLGTASGRTSTTLKTGADNTPSPVNLMIEPNSTTKTEMNNSGLKQPTSTISPIFSNNRQSIGRSEINNLLNSVSLQDLQFFVHHTHGINLNVSKMRNQSREQVLQNLLKTIQDLQKASTQAEPYALNVKVNNNPATNYYNTISVPAPNNENAGIFSSSTLNSKNENAFPNLIDTSTQSLGNQNFENPNPMVTSRHKTDNQYLIDPLTQNIRNLNLMDTSTLNTDKPNFVNASSVSWRNELVNKSINNQDSPVVTRTDINNLLNSVSIEELQRLVDQTEGFAVNLTSLGNMDRKQILQTLLAKVQAVQRQADTRSEISQTKGINSAHVNGLLSGSIGNQHTVDGGKPGQQGTHTIQNKSSVNLTHNKAIAENESVPRNNQLDRKLEGNQSKTELTGTHSSTNSQYQNQQHHVTDIANQSSYKNEPQTEAGNTLGKIVNQMEHNLKGANEENNQGPRENQPWLGRVSGAVNAENNPAIRIGAEEDQEPSQIHESYYWDHLTRTYQPIHPRFLSKLSMNNRQNDLHLKNTVTHNDWSPLQQNTGGNIDVEAPQLEDDADDSSSSSSESDER